MMISQDLSNSHEQRVHLDILAYYNLMVQVFVQVYLYYR